MTEFKKYDPQNDVVDAEVLEDDDARMEVIFKVTRIPSRVGT
jgi:hypothetical protein